MNDERGGAAIEMVILAPLLIMFMLFVVGLGRLAQTKTEVDGAARDAARAATINQDPQQAALATLANRNVTCKSPAVITSKQTFAGGDVVVVDVTCTVSLADLSLVFVPGDKAVHAHFAAPIDRYLSK